MLLQSNHNLYSYNLQSKYLFPLQGNKWTRRQEDKETSEQEYSSIVRLRANVAV